MRDSISFLGRLFVGGVSALLIVMALFSASPGYGADAPDRSPMAGPNVAPNAGPNVAPNAGPNVAPIAAPTAPGSNDLGVSPSVPGTWLPAESSVGQPVGELFFRVLSPIEPGDKGSTYTDGATDRAGAPEPTASEREKLAAARAAIESAERAGTLYGSASLLTQGPLVTPETVRPETGPDHSIDARPAGPPPAGGKPDGGRAVPPALLRPDAAACVGGGVKPLQLQGPTGLNPSERAKAAALKQSDPNRVRRERKDGIR